MFTDRINEELMLYTRLAVCLDKNEVVITWLAVHAMISHN